MDSTISIVFSMGRSFTFFWWVSSSSTTPNERRNSTRSSKVTWCNYQSIDLIICSSARLKELVGANLTNIFSFDINGINSSFSTDLAKKASEEWITCEHKSRYCIKVWLIQKVVNWKSIEVKHGEEEWV